MECPVCGSQLSPEERNRGLCAACLLEQTLETSAAPLGTEATVSWEGRSIGSTGVESVPGSAETALPEVIGRYRILGKLGEGGMGIVFEAEQQNPKRRVALKVVRGGQYVDEAQVKMFQREAETLGRLKHANIGAIYESGRTDGGQHFFAMELVRGETLDTHLARYDGPISPAELTRRLQLFRKIADAVHYAHQRGVIHRDLKPSNIIVTQTHGADESTGSAVPEIKILDFGLARITEGDIAAATVITEVGLIKGTLPYMSPEQARGLPEEIDLRTDVYALGVILYEMLTGQRPYDTQKSALIEAVRVIQETPPTPLKQVWNGTRKLDEDLATIVGKALEKDADQRYDSAASLSDDVGRYLASQPIQARPPSTIYQLQKLVERNKLGTVFAASMLLVLIGFGIWLAVVYVRALRAESEAVTERDRARAVSLLALARVEDERYPTAALAYATKSLEVLDTPAARRLALQIPMQGPVARILTTPTLPGGAQSGLAISPQGKWILASMPVTGEVLIYNRDGSHHKTLELPPHVVQRRTSFGTLDDHFVVHDPYDPLVRVFSLPQGELSWSFNPGPADRDARQDFYDNKLLIHSRVGGEEIFVGTYWLTELRFREDAYPITKGPSRPLWQWDPTMGGRDPIDNALHPSGVWQATAFEGGEIAEVPVEQIGDESAYTTITTHDEEILSLRFSPSGNHLYGKDVSESVFVLTLRDLEVVSTQIVDNVRQGFSNVRGDEAAGDFVPKLDSSGRRLAWGSTSERTVFLKDLLGPPDATPVSLPRHDEDRVVDGEFDPRGEWLATRHDNSITFWSLDDTWSLRFPPTSEISEGFVLSPDGRYLAACEKGGVRVWPLVPDAEDTRLINTQCSGVTMHPVEAKLLYGRTDNVAEIVSLDDGSVYSLDGVPQAWPVGMAFDRYDNRVGLGIYEPTNFPLEVWDLDTGEHTTIPLEVPAEESLISVLNLRFLPDGTLVSAGHGGVRRWDPKQGTSEPLYEASTARMDLSPDGGSLLVTSGERRALTLANTELFIEDLVSGTHTPIATHGNQVQSVAFGPKGRVIVTGSADGTVRVGPVTGEEPHLLLGHEGHVKTVAISADGEWIFSVAGPQIRRWPMPDLSRPPLHSMPKEDLLDYLHSLTNLRVVEAPDTDEGWKLEIGPF